MSKLSRETVIAEALLLLDQVGLDAISTRQLAKRLGVEQPSLYWHFRKKEELLAAMAEKAMAPHAESPLPTPSDEWRSWFADYMRSFRRALLLHRDGARLHAGTRPKKGQMEKIMRRLNFLIASGIPEQDAKMAWLAANYFTVGSVLEEQADASLRADSDLPPVDHEAAFEAGLALIIDGLATR